ncbi:hypothetical protein E1265_34070 [Streptomyces sp. 8K308]|uniref:AMIN-like domain-containing (lipo)protein n=1 Tax=Streptomyces sp. 8K308 TaxID=2530388 RepID=UPI00104E8B6B|nr:hypothetical protein [Streptomyces sp. 8K308]TDC07337.1 hypothetical protein E1265_34070 [Streptomyces sp. 8K308]
MPRHRPRRRLALATTTAALVPLLLVAACGEEGDPAGTESSASSDETSQPTGAEEVTAEVGVETEAPADAAVGEWDAERKDSPALGVGVPRLREVLVTGHDGYDRVTFAFEGGAPQVIASYVDELPSGDQEPRDIAGAHDLQIVLVGVDEQSGFAPADLTDTVREVRDFGVFEGELRVVLGLDTPGGGAPGFRVTSDEDEVAVDIAHEQAG